MDEKNLAEFLIRKVLNCVSEHFYDEVPVLSTEQKNALLNISDTTRAEIVFELSATLSERYRDGRQSVECASVRMQENLMTKAEKQFARLREVSLSTIGDCISLCQTKIDWTKTHDRHEDNCKRCRANRS